MGRVDKFDKNLKKSLKKDSDTSSTGAIIAIVLLAIMVLSIAGFALMSSGGGTESADQTSQDVPLQQFKDPNYGVFWGAIKNGEKFIYADISGYDNATRVIAVADAIRNLSTVVIYQDNSVVSSDAMFIVEKTMRGIGKPYSRVMSTDCSVPTLVLSSNTSKKYSNKCIVLPLIEGEEVRNADILSYFLIQ